MSYRAIILGTAMIAVLITVWFVMPANWPFTLSSKTREQRHHYLIDVFRPDREVVRRWQVADFDINHALQLRGRDIRRGKAVYIAARCIQCHKAANVGSDLGPDMTDLGARLKPSETLRDTLDPAATINDKFKTRFFLMEDGSQLKGLVVREDETRIWISVDPLVDDKLTVVRRDEIDEEAPTATSSMPSGLLDTFERDEILDLLAFLHSDENG